MVKAVEAVEAVEAVKAVKAVDAAAKVVRAVDPAQSWPGPAGTWPDPAGGGGGCEGGAASRPGSCRPVGTRLLGGVLGRVRGRCVCGRARVGCGAAPRIAQQAVCLPNDIVRAKRKEMV